MLCPAALALVAVLSCCGASPISKGSNGTNLEDRGIQPPCIASQYLATPIDNNAPGDGDPHQNYYHIQLSDNINCEGGSCQTSESNTDSKTIGFTIGTNSNAKKLGWFQGGFSVSETWTTGNAYTCDGTAGEIVCVWQNVAHTAYTVAVESTECGASPIRSQPYVMKSPNTGNVGGGFYCVRGATACRNKGAAYWDDNGCAGGPQGYCGT